MSPPPDGRRLAVGVPGFDEIADGGLPRGRATLVVGTSGAGKTVFAVQYLVAGAQAGERGVLVTFEEPPGDLLTHFDAPPWDLAGAVGQGRVVIVDATATDEEDHAELGPFDLGGLLLRVGEAVRGIGATRVVLDSVGSLFAVFADAGAVRRELRRMVRALHGMGVTTLITAERVDEYGSVARHGIEEFVVDGVVVLRNPLEQEKRRRTVEILKLRGASHRRGEYPFAIDARRGLSVIPDSAIELGRTPGGERISSGIADLDRMCGGGLFSDSMVLVSGPTGSGKTLVVTEFMRAGIARGEPGLLLSLEEGREQLVRNALSWGIDLGAAEDAGRLRILARDPDRMSLEDLLVQVRGEVDDLGPRRVAVDGLGVLERTQAPRPLREFVAGLAATLKDRGVPAVLTTTSPLAGAGPAAEGQVPAISDCVVLLRYVETPGAVRRALTVLKMRGSRHDTSIREFVITGDGMHILDPLGEVSGLLWAPGPAGAAEAAR
ncbi:MAG: circadian clock protein KaiC [Thermoleophilia bacterium]|nr:circadian clock protein KaiC [Thermoleophilia bacterium]